MPAEPNDESEPADAREPESTDSERRARAAWRTWLSALASDADAAMAAALAYESLPPEAREAWLDALEADASTLGVPCLALYAPLIAVEADGERRGRMLAAVASDPAARVPGLGRGRELRGVAFDGVHACAVVAPVYLDFVEILSCRYTPTGGFLIAEHDPFRHAGDVEGIREVGGVAVEPTPLRVVVEELAHAVLADRRAQRDLPAALASFAHLFGPDLEEAEDADRGGP
jgi:hypothetical protein